MQTAGIKLTDTMSFPLILVLVLVVCFLGFNKAVTFEKLEQEELAAVKEFLGSIEANPMSKLDAIFKKIYTDHPEIKAQYKFANIPTEDLHNDETYGRIVNAAAEMEVEALEYIGDPDGAAAFYIRTLEELESNGIAPPSPDAVGYYIELMEKLVSDQGNPALTSGMKKLRGYRELFHPHDESAENQLTGIEILEPDELDAVKQFLGSIKANPKSKLDPLFKKIFTDHPEVKAKYKFANISTENLHNDETYRRIVNAAAKIEYAAFEYRGDPNGAAAFYTRTLEDLEYKDMHLLSAAAIAYYIELMQELVADEGNPALTSGMKKLILGYHDIFRVALLRRRFKALFPRQLAVSLYIG